MKIFYTAYLKNDWKNIIQKHLNAIKDNGLLQKVSSFNIHAFPKNIQLDSIINDFNFNKNINLYYQNGNRYQFPALQDLIKNCDDYNLYLHTKGASRYNNLYEQKWNNYMSYFVINKWEKCIDLLKNKKCDAVGVEWHCNNHFSGNFWWASKEHIEKLKNFRFRDRFSAQKFIGSVPGTYISLCNYDVDLYNNIINPQKWILKQNVYVLK